MAGKEIRKHFYIAIDEEVYKKLVELAKKEKRCVGNYVSIILENYVRNLNKEEQR